MLWKETKFSQINFSPSHTFPLFHAVGMSCNSTVYSKDKQKANRPTRPAAQHPETKVFNSVTPFQSPTDAAHWPYTTPGPAEQPSLLQARFLPAQSSACAQELQKAKRCSQIVLPSTTH